MENWIETTDIAPTSFSRAMTGGNPNISLSGKHSPATKKRIERYIKRLEDWRAFLMFFDVPCSDRAKSGVLPSLKELSEIYKTVKDWPLAKGLTDPLLPEKKVTRRRFRKSKINGVISRKNMLCFSIKRNIYDKPNGWFMMLMGRLMTPEEEYQLKKSGTSIYYDGVLHFLNWPWSETEQIARSFLENVCDVA